MSVEELHILNGPFVVDDEGHDETIDLIVLLKQAMVDIQSNFLDQDNKLDYVRLESSQIFQDYLQLSGKLAHINLSMLKTDEEKKAFFINLYNVQMIHALISLDSMPESPLKVSGMWSKFAYNVGSCLFTLDDIEHGVLRCNRGHPSKNGVPAFPLPDDPRLTCVLHEFDPRIHFALNCGAQSCPPIRVYMAEKIDSQLQLAAKGFCSQEIQVLESGQIEVSKLLLWYRLDFGTTESEILLNLSSYIQDQKVKSQILEAIDNPDLPEKIVFRDYNWKTNSAS